MNRRFLLGRGQWRIRRRHRRGIKCLPASIASRINPRSVDRQIPDPPSGMRRQPSISTATVAAEYPCADPAAQSSTFVQNTTNPGVAENPAASKTAPTPAVPADPAPPPSAFPPPTTPCAIPPAHSAETGLLLLSSPAPTNSPPASPDHPPPRSPTSRIRRRRHHHRRHRPGNRLQARHHLHGWFFLTCGGRLPPLSRIHPHHPRHRRRQTRRRKNLRRQSLPQQIRADPRLVPLPFHPSANRRSNPSMDPRNSTVLATLCSPDRIVTLADVAS